MALVHLMTYNVNHSNGELSTTLDAIAGVDLDLVLLQEVTPIWQRAICDRFVAQYPVQLFHLHPRYGGGLAVLSKSPIVTEQLLAAPDGGWFPAQRLVVTTRLGDLQVLNVHLRPSLDDGSWFKGFITTPPLRRREIEAHWSTLSSDLPTIVAGDFNEDPTGLAIDFLASHGFARIATTGPATWHHEESVDGAPWDLLKMDLDHVLVGPRLIGVEGQVLDAGASDHRPVIATIARAITGS